MRCFPFATPAYAQAIDPRRIASCQLAAENLRGRSQPNTPDYTRYGGDATYWAGQVQRFVPGVAQREALLAEGHVALDQALSQQGLLAALLMLGQVLDQCNANKSVIEGATPNG